MEHTPELILRFAQDAKNLVADATDWIEEIQSLPPEWERSLLSDNPEDERDYRENQGVQFWNKATGCQLSSPLVRSTLTNCAYARDVRFMVSCGMAMSDWEPVMAMRTAFDAAAYFGFQCYHFADRILPRMNPTSDATERAQDRDDANEMLYPCVCVEHVQEAIDYEAAWLLHSLCGVPQPRMWDISGTHWLTAAIEADVRTPLPPSSSSNWLKVTEAADMLGINKAYIGRLVDSKDLTDNGLTGHDRRIAPASVLRYAKAEGITINYT